MLVRGLLPVLALLVMFVPPTLGQLPKRVEKCLPYPTLAQEIRDMQPTDPAPSRVRVRVIRVEFDSKDGIPASVRKKISTELRSHIFERDEDIAYLNDLANEIAEVGVKGALHDHGYFRAIADAKLTTIKSEVAEVSVAVTISAKPGTQYRLGDIRIESADGSSLEFSPEVLRALTPLKRAELFRVERLRTGVKNITLAYRREGYVDMTPAPDLAIDEAHETIAVVLKIDQQAQYRVGSIEFLGVNTVTQEKLMESLPKPGEIFDGTRLDDFFKVNRAILPSDASKDDVNIKRDLKARTVAILFDFWTCSPTAL